MLDTACPVVTPLAAGVAGAMLVELRVIDQRYLAVLEVVSGAPVTKVARPVWGWQAVHDWLGWYERVELAGLASHSGALRCY
jgi:hypothetical protein